MEKFHKVFDTAPAPESLLIIVIGLGLQIYQKQTLA